MPKEEPTLTIDIHGDKYWRNKKGKLHRIDGPAIDWKDGSQEWYKNGKRHRIDGPAIEHRDGDKAWYKMGKLHRIDGPAVEYGNGNKFWYQMGRQHRIDGPAVEWNSGRREWYLGGVRFESKEVFFDALNDEEKSIALFSEVFLNA